MNEQFMTRLNGLQLQLTQQMMEAAARIEHLLSMKERSPAQTDAMATLIVRESQCKVQHSLVSDIRKVYEELHPYLNSDDYIKLLGESIAFDIQMQIDDGDLAKNIETIDYFTEREIANKLIQEVEQKRGR